MKKPQIHIFAALTAVFAAFTLGFFLGRNQNQGFLTISVPAHMQTAPAETTAAAETPTEETHAIVFPIDINRAGKEELMALPGIGEVLAGRILTYRDQNGSFSAPEGLMNVEGIGEKRMEAIWDLITVGG